MVKKFFPVPILLLLPFFVQSQLGEINECSIQEFHDHVGRVSKIIGKDCEVRSYFYCKNGKRVDHPNKCKEAVPAVPSLEESTIYDLNRTYGKDLIIPIEDNDSYESGRTGTMGQ